MPKNKTTETKATSKTKKSVKTLKPKIEDIEEVDDLYNKFLDDGIDVFDTTEFDIDESKSATELEKELESLATMEEGYLSDPVRMYLREIGRVSQIHSHRVRKITLF